METGQQGPVCLGLALGHGNVTSENDRHGLSLLPDSLSARHFESLPSCPRTVCWPGGSLRPTVTARASTTAAGSVPRLSVLGRTTATVCLRVEACVRVCAFRAPSGGEQRVSEECDYRTQWEEAGLWQVWLKMEGLARERARK